MENVVARIWKLLVALGGVPLLECGIITNEQHDDIAWVVIVTIPAYKFAYTILELGLWFETDATLGMRNVGKCHCNVSRWQRLQGAFWMWTPQSLAKVVNETGDWFRGIVAQVEHFVIGAKRETPNNTINNIIHIGEITLEFHIATPGVLFLIQAQWLVFRNGIGPQVNGHVWSPKWSVHSKEAQASDLDAEEVVINEGPRLIGLFRGTINI
mmetsp:Transcript_9743/g.36262  ORF Transcript_9743/g.36262 Transcript_9743/m.36262 type:complete len:212 (+) Transcript_9743:1827-2462(+)